MLPLVDTHCHLFAGTDDGPQTDEDALAMCRLAYEDGIRMSWALAHQNEHYPDNTPHRLRQAFLHLQGQLREERIGLTVFPCAEVMVHPEVCDSWRDGQLLSVADRREYLLIEMPHQLFVDLAHVAAGLVEEGVRPVIAHAERTSELLHQPGRVEELIEIGCVIQVSASSITNPKTSRDARALKSWFRRGVAHVLGSDAHSPRRRVPKMADAYHQIVHWAGSQVADRVGSIHATAIVLGQKVRLPKLTPRSWLTKLFG